MLCKRCSLTPILRTFPSERRSTPTLVHLSPRHLLILRRYVFDNYTWDKSPGDFSTFAGKPIPARVPLTAIVSGILPLARMRACIIFIPPPFQALSPVTHFRHPQVAHQRSSPNFLTKFAQLVPLLIGMRSAAL